MDVPVDEARKDQPVLQVGELEAGMPSADVGEGAEIRDGAILDDQESVAREPRGVLLVPDVLPWVVDEIEERPSDRSAGTRHQIASVQ
jgi:hypothetical protein